MGMGMGGLFQPVDPYDKPFKREELDLKRLTFTFISQGYNLYQLVREDNGQSQRVWAKSEEDVHRYAPGLVERADYENISLASVIVHPKEDGGGINVMGTLVHCHECIK